jgi:hypothetical protein
VRRRRFPRWLVAVAMVGLLVAATLITGPPGSTAPLDPDSTASDGLRGVRDLLTEVGVDVEVSLERPVDISTKVFVPLDLLGTQRRDDLLAWVRDGGTLVVADPGSPLHGLTSGGAGLAGALGATPRRPNCDLEGLDEVGEVLHSGWRGFEAPDGAVACFPVGDDQAWLVVRREGEGTVIALGSADPLTNGQLDRADNAVLAAALLGPAPGDHLVVVPRPAVGEGDTGLLDLVPTRIWRGLAVLFVAVVLAALWRSRRLGPPVAERLPPVVPSAELARSVAGLLQRAHSRQGAADQLRAGARREAAERLGAAPMSRPADLVALATTRTTIDPDVARTALLDGPVDDDQTLVAVARASAETRRASLRTGEPASTGEADPGGQRSSHTSTKRWSDG